MTARSILLSLSFVAASIPAAWADKFDDRAQKAADAITAIASIPEKSFPDFFMTKARCVAVIPNEISGGFIFGAKVGFGLVSCRANDEWSVPSYVKLEGGSFGFQIGAEGTDLVLFFLSDKAVDQASLSRVQLGAGASVAGGPVGRDAEGATNPTFVDKIVSYSRSRGVFAGADVSGAAFLTDGTANASVYGKDSKPVAKTLLTTPRSQAKTPLSTGIDAFLDTLTQLRKAAQARQTAAGN